MQSSHEIEQVDSMPVPRCAAMERRWKKSCMGPSYCQEDVLGRYESSRFPLQVLLDSAKLIITGNRPGKSGMVEPGVTESNGRQICPGQREVKREKTAMSISRHLEKHPDRCPILSPLSLPFNCNASDYVQL